MRHPREGAARGHRAQPRDDPPGAPPEVLPTVWCELVTEIVDGLARAASVTIDGGEYELRATSLVLHFSPHLVARRSSGHVTISGTIPSGEPAGDADLSPLADAELHLHLQSSGAVYLKCNVANLAGAVTLDVVGTVDEPRVSGKLDLSPGGTISPAGLRATFETAAGTIDFRPGEAPEVQLDARTTLRSADDRSHVIDAVVAGPWNHPTFSFRSADGLDPAGTMQLLVTGLTPEEVRTAIGAVGVPASDPRPAFELNLQLERLRLHLQKRRLDRVSPMGDYPAPEDPLGRLPQLDEPWAK